MFTSLRKTPVLRCRSNLLLSFLLVLLILLTVPHCWSQERVTLRLTDWADLDEMPLDERALAEFKQLNPWIDVVYEPNPGRQYEEKILTALAADAPPDVFLLDSKLIPTFTNKKVLLDLSRYIQELGIDTTQWYPNVLAIARKGSSLFAFPKGFSPLMVYYNKRLFEQAGLAPPSRNWTWEKYLRLATALTRDLDGNGTTDQYGASFTNYFYYWIVWVWNGGGDVVDPDGTRATGFLNSPETEYSLKFLSDLQREHHVAPETGSWIQAEKTGMNVQLFLNGKIAMILDGHWRVPRLLKQIAQGNLDIGVVPPPVRIAGPRVNVMYESGWCVPTNSRHPREAALLASFMAGKQANLIRASRNLEIPSVRSVAEEMVAKDTLGIEKAFVDEVPFCRQPWGSRIERFSEIEWTLQDAVDEVMINHQPVHATFTKYAARIDQTLKGIRSNEHYEFQPINKHSEILEFLFGVGILILAVCAGMYFRARGKSREKIGSAMGFLTPSLLHLVIFVFTPIVFSAYLSFHRWDVVVPDKPFVGLGNFSEMMSDPGFWNALKNTLLFTLNVPIGMALALGVALMMNRQLKGVSLLRALYFLPSITSFVAIALVWMWIYHPTFGLANFVLNLVGLGPLQWLNSTDTAMISVIIFSIWLGLGYQMVIFLAGLQGIPEEYLDAARIDGANSWKRFWHVTLPLLKPTTFFILITSIISSFQVFTSIYVMTAGGPVKSTDVLVYHIYQAAWEELRMGYASAMSWVLFVIIMVATWVQFKIAGDDVEYG